MTAESPTRTRWTGTLLLTAILFVLVSMLSMVPFVRELGLRLSDSVYRVAPQPAKPSKVVLILIDDQSLQAYGRWPWSRTLLAQLTRNLNQAGAQAVGIDILLSEPQSADADLALARAIKESGAVIVDKIGAYPDGPRWIEPLAQFAHSAGAVGHAQAVLDRDGVCRRFPVQELTADGARFSFGLEVARRVDKNAADQFLEKNGISAIDDNSPLTRVKPTLVTIPFRRSGIEVISAVDALRGTNLESVRGKPVLVGFGPTEISDRINTPLSSGLPAPGVEVHAQILDAILAGRSLRDLSLWLSAVLLVFTSLLAIVALRRLQGWRGITAMMAGGLLLYALAVLAFAYASWNIPIGALLLSLVLAPPIAYAAEFILVERSVSKQMHELRRWLAPDQRQTSSAGDLWWRLRLLRQLQDQLGALYELHTTVMETTQDAVAIFDANGRLTLSNHCFRKLLPSSSAGLTLNSFQSMIASDDCPSPRELDSNQEREINVAGEPYSIRVAQLPPTSLTPSGGTVVTLSSLKLREERDRARAEALGFVTHELRAPLVAIQGFSELMIEYPGSPTCAKAPETILRESKRLLALINTYLDVLRLDAGARPIRLERIELNAVIQEVLELVKPLATAAGSELVFESEPVTMDADRALVAGAVLNLVSNAVKYGRMGSNIAVRCARNGGAVVVGVHNQGEPIPQELLPRLFDPYYRAPSVESGKPGTGLGLAFVKRIAEKHGGAVSVHSGAGGTTFEITLPLDRGGAVAAKGAA